MHCQLCPRNCVVNRNVESGFCRAGALPTVAKIMLHHWEEPCICYGSGSGAIFFSACQMRCLYCQNHSISRAPVGKEMDANALCNAFFELKDKGACNINLVSPTPHLRTLIPAIELAKNRGLGIPFVFNSGGYEKSQIIEKLDGLIDIYLLDFKYHSNELAVKYSHATNYREHCIDSLLEAIKQTGAPSFEGEKLTKGVIVRHLVLPGTVTDSLSILQDLKSLHLEEHIILSLMRQYTPTAQVKDIPPLSRRLTSLEYRKVTSLAEQLRFKHIYTQKKESASEDFIPEFLGNN